MLFVKILIALLILIGIALFYQWLHLLAETKDLKKIRKDLEEQLEEMSNCATAKDSFIAGISHELKTPLNTILGMSYLLLRTPLSDKQKDLLSKIESSGDVLLGIIEDVLDLSKLKLHSLNIHPAPVPLTRIVNDAEMLLSDQIIAKGLSWRCNCNFRPDLILNLDKHRLTQILINLIGNAIKFTERGFISLEIETNFCSERQVDLIIRVKDSGIGIRPENLSRIFEEFEQLENHMTKYHQGTGLGLPITKQLVTAMGGTIRVDSALGQGSRFTVSLPGVPIEKEISSSCASAAACPQIQKDVPPILIVDDTAINAEIAQQLLLEMGLNSCTACDGTEAIRLCRHNLQSHYSLILMDIHMPKLNGYDTAFILKNEIGVTCPIIALTATFIDEISRQKSKGIIDGVILKPFKALEFQKTVASFLNAHVKKAGTAPETDSPETDFAKAAPAPAAPTAKTVPHSRKSPCCSPLISFEEGLSHFDGRTDLYEKYYRKFCLKYADVDKEIENQLRAGNLEEAHRTVHSVKGLASMLGFNALTAAALELEHTIKEGNSEELPSLLHTFSSILEQSISSRNFSDQLSG